MHQSKCLADNTSKQILNVLESKCLALSLVFRCHNPCSHIFLKRGATWNQTLCVSMSPRLVMQTTTLNTNGHLCYKWIFWTKPFVNGVNLCLYVFTSLNLPRVFFILSYNNGAYSIIIYFIFPLFTCDSDAAMQILNIGLILILHQTVSGASSGTCPHIRCTESAHKSSSVMVLPNILIYIYFYSCIN